MDDVLILPNSKLGLISCCRKALPTTRLRENIKDLITKEQRTGILILKGFGFSIKL
jgi:hypothetical protein